MKHILTLLILVTTSMYFSVAQSEIPGQSAFESTYGADLDLDLEKCCIAAYGWHIAKELKVDAVDLISLKDNNVAQEILKSNISPKSKEQYFLTPDGRIVVVHSQDQFEKVYGRYLINLKATSR